MEKYSSEDKAPFQQKLETKMFFVDIHAVTYVSFFTFYL